MKKLYIKFLALGVLSLFFISCGGGKTSSDNGTQSIALSGVVQKGLFFSGEVTAQRLNDKAELIGNISKSPINNKGQYSLHTDNTNLVLLKAKGKYLNEYTGKKSTQEATLYALADLRNEESDTGININLFTSLEIRRIVALMQKGTTYDKAQKETKKSMLNVFGLSSDVMASDLNIYDLKGKDKEANKNLLLFSATLLKVEQESLSKRAKLFGVNPSPILERLLVDYEEDGALKNGFSANFNAMKNDNVQNTWSIATANIGLADSTPPVLVWANVTPMVITEFALRSMTKDGEEHNYTGADALFLGLVSSNSSIKLGLKSTGNDDYGVDIYLESEGQSNIKVKDNAQVQNHNLTVTVDINSSIRAFFAEAYENNKEVTFKAYPDGINLAKRTDTLPVLVYVSEELSVNSTLLAINSADYVGALDNTCVDNSAVLNTNTTQHLSLDMNVTWKPSDKWSDANGSISEGCMELVYNTATDSFDATMKDNEITFANTFIVSPSQAIIDSPLNPLEDSSLELAIILVNTSVDSNGNFKGSEQAMSIYNIHSKQTVHYMNTIENIIHAQSSSVFFLGVNLNGMSFSNGWDDNISLSLPSTYFGISVPNIDLTQVFMHSDGMPFYMNISNADITYNQEGLHFSNVSARYVHRDFGDIVSNDVFFVNPTATFGMHINDEGLQTDSDLTFSLISDGETLFPHSKASQNGFSVSIVDDKMIPTSPSGAGQFTFGYNSECKDASCSDSNAANIEYVFDSSNTYMAPDGALMSQVNIANKKIAWGSQENNKNIFERNADTSGVMYIPGFSINTNNPDNLVSYLMGSRDIDAGKLAKTRPLNSDDFNVKGNGLFAGLNVGSLYLDDRGSDPLVSLDGTKMDVLLGGITKTTLNLKNNLYTKYYIRPSGITGVFNGTLSSNAVNVYGFPMEFRRFAFAQVKNSLEEKTWIDAEVSVPSPAGFDISFSSLALDCTGALNGGLVDASDCEAEPKTNCEQTLDAWKSKTKFVSASFTPNSPDVCGDRDLSVNHIVNVNALTRPLGLLATWQPSGNASQSKMTGGTLNYLDRDTSDSGQKGFPLNLSADAQLSNQGWYKLSAKIALPFWEMQDTDIGLKNKSIANRSSSIVQKKDSLDASKTFADAPNNTKLNASYQWGSTGLGISLPIAYKASASKESQFLGIAQEVDLSIMNAQAGINFITPKKTKVSFGVTADTAALGDIEIQIDLSDPDSIRSIDNTLGDLGIGGNPLQKTIGLVLEPLDALERYADKGLLLGMEELGIQALESASNAAGEDPFELVADTFAEIHALPVKVMDLSKEYVADEIDSHINAVTSEISNILTNPNNTKLTENIKTKLTRAIHALEQVEKGFTGLENVKSRLQDVENTLNGFTLADKITAVSSEIDKLLTSTCTNGVSLGDTEDILSNSELFKPINVLKNNVKDINDKIQTIEIAEVKKFAEQVKDSIDFDINDLIDAFEKTQSISRSLDDSITQAQSSINGSIQSLCDEAEDIKKEALVLISKVAELNAFKSAIARYITLARSAIDSDALQAIENNITTFKASLGTIVSKDINTDIDALLRKSSTQLSAIAKNVVADALDEIINTLDGPTIVGEKGTLRERLTELMKQIPQPTANELRRMVVTTILDTKPIEELRITLNNVISPPIDEVREVVIGLISSANRVVYAVLEQLNKKVKELLAEATSAVEDMPIVSGKMDGYANISGDELERLHIGAEWKVDSGDEDTSYSFNGALDMERWGAGGKAGCGDGSSDGNMDVKISTRDISMDLGATELTIDELYFGFTLAKAIPIGINGGIASKSGFDFEAFKLYDMRLALGIGLEETYLGATTAALFDSYQLNVAFLVGRTCGSEVLASLDPEAAKFITLPNNVFQGAFVRGGASIPIWNTGCAFTLGVTANMGVWVLIPGTYGGIIGGGAYGEALCIASLRGQVDAFFEKTSESIRFRGTGWGAAGGGSCEPHEWSSISKSRDDSWCLTGDAQFSASYEDGWQIDAPEFDAFY